MCGYRIGKFFASIGEYFSAPTFGKAAPAYAASAAPVLDIDLPDIVAVVTLIYTVVLLVGALPGLWKTWDFFKSRRHHGEGR